MSAVGPTVSEGRSLREAYTEAKEELQTWCSRTFIVAFAEIIIAVAAMSMYAIRPSVTVIVMNIVFVLGGAQVAWGAHACDRFYVRTGTCIVGIGIFILIGWSLAETFLQDDDTKLIIHIPVIVDIVNDLNLPLLPLILSPSMFQSFLVRSLTAAFVWYFYFLKRFRRSIAAHEALKSFIENRTNMLQPTYAQPVEVMQRTVVYRSPARAPPAIHSDPTSSAASTDAASFASSSDVNDSSNSSSSSSAGSDSSSEGESSSYGSVSGGKSQSESESASKGSGVGDGLCVVCIASKQEVIFYPCGHLACCQPCGEEVKAMGMPCPICRTKIKDVTKVYKT